MGPLLTTIAPEAAPGELFAGDAATLKSEQLPSDLRGFFRRWRHSHLHLGKRTSSASARRDLNPRLLRRAALGSCRIFELRERV
jgi:hypothetical protein